MGKGIWVLYIGGHGKLVHTGRDKKKPWATYVFAAKEPVHVTDATDVAFYEAKAEKNPLIWRVGKSKKAVLAGPEPAEPMPDEKPDEKKKAETPPEV